jgi:general secretion pathway protein H
MTSPVKQGTSPVKHKSAGFTLIELLIVITIMGLALALIAGHGKMRSAGLEENGVASDLAGGLRAARAQAIVQNKPVALTLDITGHRWQVDGQPMRSMPPQFVLAVTTVKGETSRGGSRARIVFEPDGSSTGGRIAFDDGLRKFAVDIDWLTGNVRVTKG